MGNNSSRAKDGYGVVCSDESIIPNPPASLDGICISFRACKVLGALQALLTRRLFALGFVNEIDFNLHPLSWKSFDDYYNQKVLNFIKAGGREGKLSGDIFCDSKIARWYELFMNLSYEPSKRISLFDGDSYNTIRLLCEASVRNNGGRSFHYVKDLLWFGQTVRLIMFLDLWIEAKDSTRDKIIQYRKYITEPLSEVPNILKSIGFDYQEYPELM